MQKIIPLVVLARKSGVLTTPEVDYFNFEGLQDISVDAVHGTQIQILGEKVTIAEKPFDLEALADLASTDVIISQRVDAGVSALGTNQATAYDIIKFLTEVDDATADTADGLAIPDALVGAVHCVINNDTLVTLDIFPQSGENFDGGTADIAVTLAPYERKHFYCAIEGQWDTVADAGV